MADSGRPLTHTALDKIERGTRRVDVDDATCQPSEPEHLLWDILRTAPFRETDGTMATIEKYQTATGTTRYMVRYRTPQHTQTK